MPATTRRPAGGQLGELCIYDDGDSLISGQALVGSYHTEVSGVSFGPSTGTSGNVSQCLAPKKYISPATVYTMFPATIVLCEAEIDSRAFDELHARDEEERDNRCESLLGLPQPHLHGGCFGSFFYIFLCRLECQSCHRVKCECSTSPSGPRAVHR